LRDVGGGWGIAMGWDGMRWETRGCVLRTIPSRRRSTVDQFIRDEGCECDGD
jgi:hypothetical protein